MHKTVPKATLLRYIELELGYTPDQMQEYKKKSRKSLLELKAGLEYFGMAEFMIKNGQILPLRNQSSPI